MGQQLRQPCLYPGHKAVLAHVLAPLGVPPGACYNVVRIVHGRVFLHNGRLIRLDGPVKERRLCPEGAHRHNADAAAFQLPVQRPAEAQHKGLCGTVDIDIGDGLKGRHGGDVDDLAAPGHIGCGDLAHGHHRLAVQVRHVQIYRQRRVQHGAELAVAAAIHQQPHLHRCLGQCRSIYIEAAAVRQVQRQHPNREGDRGAQGLQLCLMPRDDPHLVKGAIPVHRLGEPFAHAAGRACDHCDLLHTIALPVLLYPYCIPFLGGRQPVFPACGTKKEHALRRVLSALSVTRRRVRACSRASPRGCAPAAARGWWKR